MLWAIALASFLAIYVLKCRFRWVVLGAAVAGWLGARFAPAQFAGGAGHGGAQKGYGPALIDDDTPTPARALQPSRLAAGAGRGRGAVATADGALLVPRRAGTAR
jgi:chromate transporter